MGFCVTCNITCNYAKEFVQTQQNIMATFELLNASHDGSVMTCICFERKGPMNF